MYCDIPDLGRCCLCIPLRKGIIIFGYLNAIFSTFMVGSYSYTVHANTNATMLLYHGSLSPIQDEACILIHIIDLLFTILLIVGAHMKNMKYLKIYFYYAMTTLLAIIFLQIAGMSAMANINLIIEFLGLFLVGLCLHVYLLILVRSLLKKLDSPTHVYENQLHQFVNGEVKLDSTDVYTSTVVPSETV